MIFVSYYTKNTPYEEVIQKCLLSGLKRFDLPYDIQGVPDEGTWQLNTAYKSKFILEMLLKHKQDVCFLDSDAIIDKYPSLLFEIPDKYDLGAHWLDWMLQWRGKPGDNFHLLSGTMIFKYKPKVIELVKQWREEVLKDLGTWEQKIFQNMVEKRRDIKIYDLPAEYCCVLLQDYSIPPYVKDPVIIHTQASRKFKRRSNWPRVDNQA